MRLIMEEPDAFRAAREIGCVLDFVRFADAGGTDVELRTAIGMAIEHAIAPDWPKPRATVDHARLSVLTCRALTRVAFLGEWADADTGDLVFRGSLTTAAGRELVEPTFRHLETLRQAGVTIRSSGSTGVELWSGGEFAYAFAQPPYGLQATPGRVQEVFDAVCQAMLPLGDRHDIADWGSEGLVDVCPPFFECGTEWWGVFLFTIHTPATRALTVVLGATTD